MFNRKAATCTSPHISNISHPTTHQYSGEVFISYQIALGSRHLVPAAYTHDDIDMPLAACREAERLCTVTVHCISIEQWLVINTLDQISWKKSFYKECISLQKQSYCICLTLQLERKVKLVTLVQKAINLSQSMTVIRFHQQILLIF